MKLIIISFLLTNLSIAKNQFDSKDVRCKKIGSRTRVWMNTSHGSYALNGTAISWVNKAKKDGFPLIGADGKEFKIARDYIAPIKLQKLIKIGLTKCK